MKIMPTAAQVNTRSLTAALLWCSASVILGFAAIPCSWANKSKRCLS